MFLWFRIFRILISRIAVIGNCNPRRLAWVAGQGRGKPAGRVGADGPHPLLLVVHPNPLQRDDLPGVVALCLVHLPARDAGAAERGAALPALRCERAPQQGGAYP